MYIYITVLMDVDVELEKNVTKYGTYDKFEFKY